jgi:hypothetical protein
MRRAPIVLLLLVALGGCVTPSFPVPPPEPEAIVFSLDPVAGMATFRADPEPEWAFARVTITDTTSGYGVIVPAEANGEVLETPPFRAEDGDLILIEYELDDQAGGLCLILHDGRSSSEFRCR